MKNGRYLAASALLTLVLGLAGCAATPAGTGDATSQPSPPSPGATPTATASPLVTPTEAEDEDGDMLTGELGTIDVEGGCAYLEADGVRYEVIYPRGWEMNAIAGNLVDPEGRVVARAGDRITVRGRLAGDMVTICMIGPIFQATEVVSVEPR